MTPRSDSRWRAVAGSLAWVKWDKSEVHKVDNRPPGTPIRMPRGAPSPRVKLRSRDMPSVAERTSR